MTFGGNSDAIQQWPLLIYLQLDSATLRPQQKKWKTRLFNFLCFWPLGLAARLNVTKSKITYLATSKAMTLADVLSLYMCEWPLESYFIFIILKDYFCLSGFLSAFVLFFPFWETRMDNTYRVNAQTLSIVARWKFVNSFDAKVILLKRFTTTLQFHRQIMRATHWNLQCYPNKWFSPLLSSSHPGFLISWILPHFRWRH